MLRCQRPNEPPRCRYRMVTKFLGLSKRKRCSQNVTPSSCEKPVESYKGHWNPSSPWCKSGYVKQKLM
jgi:hypothetical protein